MNPIVPKYVLVIESYDRSGHVDFSECIGVYSDYFEAVGHAYVRLHEIADDITDDQSNLEIYMPQEMEGDAGDCINFKVREDKESEWLSYCACIYFNHDALKKVKKEKEMRGIKLGK